MDLRTQGHAPCPAQRGCRNSGLRKPYAGGVKSADMRATQSETASPGVGKIAAFLIRELHRPVVPAAFLFAALLFGAMTKQDLVVILFASTGRWHPVARSCNVIAVDSAQRKPPATMLYQRPVQMPRRLSTRVTQINAWPSDCTGEGGALSKLGVCAAEPMHSGSGCRAPPAAAIPPSAGAGRVEQSSALRDRGLGGHGLSTATPSRKPPACRCRARARS